MFRFKYFFWSEIGYFNTDADLKPLLHTWSLAVEEQFYLLFPAFLVTTVHYGAKPQVVLLIILAVASLLLAEWGWRNAESANFYLAPTRAWELLVGSILALSSVRLSVQSANYVSMAGLALVTFSILVFDETVPTPSIYTLVPVLGTSLILIGAVRGTLVNALLSMRLLVFIGLISYSLYLFHQPILAFWRIRTQDEILGFDVLYFLITTFVCAALSWKVVEAPMRRSSFMPARLFLATLALSIAILSLFGVHVVRNEGLPNRLSSIVNDLDEIGSWSNYCLFQIDDGAPRDMPMSDCRYGRDRNTAYAIWGDSIAAAVAPSVAAEFANLDIGLLQLTHGHCAPISGVERAYHRWSSNCREFNKVAIEMILSNKIDTVILMANWDDFFGSEYLDFGGGDILSNNINVSEQLASSLDSTIDILRSNDISVTVVYPVVRSSKDVLRYIQQSLVHQVEWPLVQETRANALNSSEFSYRILDRISRPITRIYPEAEMCEEGLCTLSSNGELLVSDKIHPTEQGAAKLAKFFVRSMPIKSDIVN
ncbi:acyltransferase family protein [Halioglobus japonicus]|uniref:Acyltransferase n=1 Tax=Halioglobus japonicus TaxID=930805 RepID=A0AAP8SM85_9GAMM|nr:acyltransferase [Halioglobus japonicus]